MSAETGTYLTSDKDIGPLEIREKGSRFISFLFPVKDESQADALRKGLRKTYHDASHVCWAYRFFRSKAESFRYDDDGEPGGTAGLPILYEIRGRDYFDVLLVVIRYFGGIKLGTGGLAKAYKRAAREVLGESIPVVCHIRKRISVRYPFGFTGEIRHLIRQFAIEVIGQEYLPDGVRIILEIPLSMVEKFETDLRERSRGSVELTSEPVKRGE